MLPAVMQLISIYQFDKYGSNSFNFVHVTIFCLAGHIMAATHSMRMV